LSDNNTTTAASQNLGNTEINLLIKNNRNYTQGASVMGSPYASGGSVNATIEYRWNFTAYIFNTSNSTLTLQYKGTNSTSYSLFSVAFAGSTAEAVAQTLNTLGISSFNTYTESGQTYVSTNNNTTIFNDLTIISTAVSVSQDIITQGGFILTTENNQTITTEVSSTTLFPVTIINHPAGDPAISVTIQDNTAPAGSTSGGGVTYAQVQQAFSQNNYEVQGLYLYSPTIEQLNSTFTYNSFDLNGNKSIFQIPNIIDPNQFVSSSILDLSQFLGAVILNGNSFVNAVMLPNASLQMKFLAKNINTNSELTSNFLDIQNATNTKFFEPPIGDISEFDRQDAIILNKIPEEVVNRTPTELLKAKIRDNINKQNNLNKGLEKSIESININKNLVPIALVGIVAIAGIYLITKKKN
jgi:hypothetical protein